MADSMTLRDCTPSQCRVSPPFHQLADTLGCAEPLRASEEVFRFHAIALRPVSIAVVASRRILANRQMTSVSLRNAHAARTVCRSVTDANKRQVVSLMTP